jgi:hypothetical protein
VALGDNRARGAVHPLIDPLAPLGELVLVVKLVGEPAARFEVGAHEAMRALQRALGEHGQLRLNGMVSSELFG